MNTTTRKPRAKDIARHLLIFWDSSDGEHFPNYVVPPYTLSHLVNSTLRGNPLAEHVETREVVR